MITKAWLKHLIKSGAIKIKPIVIAADKEYADGFERHLSDTELYYYQRFTNTLTQLTDSEDQEFRRRLYFYPLDKRDTYTRYRPRPLNIGTMDDPILYGVYKKGEDTKIRFARPEASFGVISTTASCYFNLQTGELWDGYFDPVPRSISDIGVRVLAKQVWKPADRPPRNDRYSVTARYDPAENMFSVLKCEMARYRHDFKEKADAIWVINSRLSDIMWIKGKELIAFKGYDAQYPEIELKAQELDRISITDTRLSRVMIEAEIFNRHVIVKKLHNCITVNLARELKKDLESFKKMNIEEKVAYGKHKFGFYDSTLVP